MEAYFDISRSILRFRNWDQSFCTMKLFRFLISLVSLESFLAASAIACYLWKRSLRFCRVSSLFSIEVLSEVIRSEFLTISCEIFFIRF